MAQIALGTAPSVSQKSSVRAAPARSARNRLAGDGSGGEASGSDRGCP